MFPGDQVIVEREVKGLDQVRRDWCVMSREFGSTVLDVLLSGKEREEIVDSVHTALGTLGEDARAGRVALDKFVITRGLNKSPHDYPDAKSQPHLQVRTRGSFFTHLHVNMYAWTTISIFFVLVGCVRHDQGWSHS